MSLDAGDEQINTPINKRTGPGTAVIDCPGNSRLVPTEPKNLCWVSVIQPDDAVTLAALRPQWERLVAQSGHVNALYQSPQFFDHLVAIGANPLLALVRDEFDELIGLAPVLVKTFQLKFDVCGKVLWKKSFRAAKILGSQPLLPSRADAYDSLLAALRTRLSECDCVVLESLPEESYLAEYLQEAKEIRVNWRVYVPEGTRRYPLIRLPDTVAKYMAKFGSKTRYNMKRERRLLQEEGGSLRLERVSSVEQVADFLQCARSVTANSRSRGWLAERLRPDNRPDAVLADLARRGILRSYVLRCGDRPCAFAWGYQFAAVYHLVETAYDQDFARFSPGKVLLCTIIEDLIAYDAPRLFTFDYGEAFYKDLFANWIGQDRTVVLFRRGLAAWFWRSAHQIFRKSVALARRCFKPANRP